MQKSLSGVLVFFFGSLFYSGLREQHMEKLAYFKHKTQPQTLNSQKKYRHNKVSYIT